MIECKDVIHLMCQIGSSHYLVHEMYFNTCEGLSSFSKRIHHKKNSHNMLYQNTMSHLFQEESVKINRHITNVNYLIPPTNDLNFFLN